MATPLPPQPKIRSIAIGILVMVAVTLLLCSASSMVKWVGTSFLLVPRALGLLGSVHGDEIVALPMSVSPTAVTFPRPETYAVYTADLNLLETTAGLRTSEAAPWLIVQRADTGESVPVSYIRRGLLPFDEPRVLGRPVFVFKIAQPGTYALSHPRRSFDVYLVPDRTTGKEGVIAGAVLIQLALLATAFVFLFGRPWMERRQAWRSHQRERRQASDSLMRRRAGRPRR